MSSSTLSWYSINNTGDVLTFSGDKFQVQGDVEITGNYYVNGEILRTSSQLATLGEVLPVGSFINYPWPSSPSEPSIPFGFLKCDGAEISSIIYSDLYTVIGNKYGTPIGSYSFVLPNFSNLIIKYRTTVTPSSSDLIPIASIFTIPWTINPYPVGFLKCDGSAVSREDYTILYNVIGDIYGNGDGSTTFNLPNLFNQGIKYRSTIVSSTASIQETSWTNIGNDIYYQYKVGVGTNIPRKNLDVVGTAIFTGGNVGIGITNPAVLVDIRTSTENGPELRLSEPSGRYSKISFYGTAVTDGYIHVSSLVATTNDDSNLCRLDLNAGTKTAISMVGSGRVGIGLTNPLYKTHVGFNTDETYSEFPVSIYSEKTVVADSFYARGTGTGSKPSYFGGRVGIGITNPLVGNLYVANANPATIYLHDTTQGSSQGLDDNQGWRLDHGTLGSNKFAITQNPFTHRFVIDDDGNVGIGNTTPSYLLTVGPASSNYVRAQGGRIELLGGTSNADLRIISEFGYGNIGVNNNKGLSFATFGEPRMMITSNGYVGIGSTNPTEGRFVVRSGPYYTINSTYAVGGGTGADIFGINNHTRTWAVWTNNSMYASEGYAHGSDRRIKKDIVEINDDEALGKLRLIQPTKYKYIDQSRGTSEIFGFIAQQVREHFPEAVSLINDFIPDVYEAHEVDIPKQTVTLVGKAKTGKLHLITKNRRLDVEVTNPEPDVVQLPEGTLTEEDLFEDKVFVYGYKIEDFHALNKDYLFTINFAATQELDRKVQALESENTSLKSMILTLVERTQNLQSENLHLSEHLSKLETLLRDRGVIP